MTTVELRHGKFGPYFYDDGVCGTDRDRELGLNEVCIRLNNEVHLRKETGEVLKQLDELAEQWGDEAVFNRCRQRLLAALVYQAELVPLRRVDG